MAAFLSESWCPYLPQKNMNVPSITKRCNIHLILAQVHAETMDLAKASTSMFIHVDV